MVDAINLKLEEVKRDCDTMAANLKSALEEGEPLRKAKEKLEKQKEYMKRQLAELENKVQALEVTNGQLQLAQEENASKAEKHITKTKIKELEAR
ncbi:hypothetical protein LSH36_824g03033 [Paralvinella palmiformis]|uniref:Uncharacterized protein n=1 Tax=Paralvinella palmiformis TaxID=53620 RepID=A0AAD9IZ90_9ANNE|nr:hypothetical protein LSH36_824g03033 [Paralvinella palmiformis]